MEALWTSLLTSSWHEFYFPFESVLPWGWSRGGLLRRGAHVEEAASTGSTPSIVCWITRNGESNSNSTGNLKIILHASLKSPEMEWNSDAVWSGLPLCAGFILKLDPFTTRQIDASTSPRPPVSTSHHWGGEGTFISQTTKSLPL